MNNNVDITEEYIQFKTKSKWNVEELNKFLSSISEIYNILFALDLEKRLLIEKIENQKYTLKKQRDSYNNINSEYLIEMDKYIKILDVDLELVHKNIFPESTYFSYDRKFFKQFGSKNLEAKEIIRDIDDYLTNDEKLQIRCIVMKSPGSLVLYGLGYLIKQIRELICEVIYYKENKRRKQLENLKLQIEVVRDSIKLKNKNPDEELVRIVNMNVSNVLELESNAKLENIKENIDYNPK